MSSPGPKHSFVLLYFVVSIKYKTNIDENKDKAIRLKIYDNICNKGHVVYVCKVIIW